MGAKLWFSTIGMKFNGIFLIKERVVIYFDLRMQEEQA
jgi:hypothetical protein